MMQGFLAQMPQAGLYIAWWKALIFFLCLLGWGSVGSWINHDTREVNTYRPFWNNLYALFGAVGFLLFILLPAPFILEWLLFLIIWLTFSLVYVWHRNARVPDNERILTADHFKSLFNRTPKKQAHHRLTFISAHGNRLPIPGRDAPEYDGYLVSEEIVYDIYQHRSTGSKFLPLGEDYVVHYTVDGMSSKTGQRDRAEMEAAIAYLKAVADLDVADRRKPQSGSFQIEIGGHKIDFRVKTAGSTRGEQLGLEKIEDTELLPIDEVGFLPDQLQAMETLIREPGPGIVLICGKPQSGVTTTLYSLIRKHDAFTQNIYALEIDPQMDLDNITQHKVERGAAPEQCARQLQTVLRTDPDIVLVGFCNGADMAKIGTKAAREGKRLYFGLTQTSVFDGLQEWMKMVANHAYVAETLQAITYQVLLRKLCPDCREAYAPDAQMLRRLNLPVGKVKQFFRPPTELEYDKHGNVILCETCQGSGYYGRTAVFETLFLTDSVKEVIRQGGDINAIRAQARKERVLYLQEQAIRKVIDGVTSIQEVLRVTTEKTAKANAKTDEPTAENS